ncbi:hypothetical protein AVEN_87313-1 [Araneus ventricosus]|uniref:Uncharacterized protein n=1 Tax=Araneus ventricosus TaxID=182803 RepID=A0A4Y2PQN4_ARAVE|nr:hypothetical protein AVEN_87313-1 [Araneus ventricosus]
MIQRATGPIHGGSTVDSGFEPVTLQSRGQDLTTRSLRHSRIVIKCGDLSVLFSNLVQKHELAHGASKARPPVSSDNKCGEILEILVVSK